VGGTDTTQGSTSSNDDDDAQITLAPGARIGRYVVIERLGAGAMGTVYAARDPALDRRVALKLIRARVAGPVVEARLLREAQAMARLSHPDVISVFDAGRDGEHLYIAMEIVDGGTLRDWAHGKRRTWREVLAVYLRAARGLAHAHEAGLVHRDFKPDNVLVGRDGRVRVTDFGLARDDQAAALRGGGVRSTSPHAIDVEGSTLATSLTRTGALVGTPVYMAPEQLVGLDVDARSDVYSFCVALYEALYGERPFGGDSMQALTTAKLDADVRPAPAGSKVPARLRRALLVGLRPRAEDRYPSMTALIAALERAARVPWLGVVGVAAGVAAAAAAIAIAARPARVTTSAAPVASTASGCTSGAACTALHGGEPHACRASDGACVPLASEDCTAKYEPGDLADADTIWLGAMFPLTGPQAAAYGEMNLEGVDFARREIAEATRSLHGATASSRVRRIALVACDDTVDPMRAAHHLVDDVGVPAILGFGSGQKVIDVAGSFLIGRGVLTVASITPSPLITRLPQPRDLPPMVWRTTFDLDDVAIAAARVIHDVFEPRVHHPVRVVLARDTSATALSFGEALYGALVFNGRPAVENGRDYQQVTFPRGQLAPADVKAATDRIAEAAPTVVVFMGGDEAGLAAIAEAVENGRSTGPRPIYLLGNANLTRFATYLGASVDRRQRLYTIYLRPLPSAAGRFVLRYNETHATPIDLTRTPSTSYDAFFLLAYGVFALGDAHVTGPSLARAFARLVPPGPEVEVGRAHVLDGLKLLSAGSTIDLRGAGGGLDFDLSRGDAREDFALVCADADARGATGGEVESGVVVRALTGTTEGTLRCP
jgi:tRNA A-37 threonylcarbamoyl transferase component Bud32/ABC-type branched-subunit amino acid transport system substrate-binding protein